ncbi:hypothetical protein ABIE78_004493 [Sinorhizobium fredii]
MRRGRTARPSLKSCHRPRSVRSAGDVERDDGGERCAIGILADIGILRPDELVAGHALAGSRHPGEPKIGGIGQNSGEKGTLVGTAFGGAQFVKAAMKPVSRATSCRSSVMRIRGINASSRSASASASQGTAVLTDEICSRSSTKRTPSSWSRLRRCANFFSRQSSSRPRCWSHSSAAVGSPRSATIGAAARSGRR